MTSFSSVLPDEQGDLMHNLKGLLEMVLTGLQFCCLAVNYSWHLQLEHGRCYKHQ